MRQQALDALHATGSSFLGTSHRTSTVKDHVKRLQDGLADLFDLPTGYEVMLTNGGATAFWDMATVGLVRERSRHYVFGEFSSKFAAATSAAPFLRDPDVVEVAVGTSPTMSDADDVDVQAVTHNETSTGAMMQVTRPADGTLVLVDATSGAGGLPVDASEFDVYYFSLQKGFASDGGLVVALMSPDAIARADELAATDRWVPTFLDLPTAVANARQHQTYNTPALATIFLAAEQVDWMLDEGGLAAMVEGSRAKSSALYDWAESRDWATPFVANPAERSLVVGTIDLDGPDADDVNAALRSNGILDTDGYRKLGRNQLRVGMFPAVDLADVQAYTACVDHVVESLTA